MIQFIEEKEAMQRVLVSDTLSTLFIGWALVIVSQYHGKCLLCRGPFV